MTTIITYITLGVISAIMAGGCGVAIFGKKALDEANNADR